MEARRVKNIISKRLSSQSPVWKWMRAAGTLSFQYQFKRHYNQEPFHTFQEIYIELVNYCNLRCIWCALDHNAPHERMELSLFEEFLKEHHSDIRLQNLKWIHLHNGGETLLHPQFPEFLQLIEQYKSKAEQLGIPFPKVSLLTNGTVFHEKNAQAIASSGVVDLFRFSMDGGSPEAYEEIRHKADWKKFSKNLKQYLQANKASKNPAETGIICLLKSDQKPGETHFHPEFVELLRAVDDYEIRYAHDWAGEISLGEEEQQKAAMEKLPFYKRSCNLLLHSVVLMPKGQITACCADLNAKGMLGWFPQKRIADIYAGQKRLQMLKHISKGEHKKIELCKNCEGF